MLTYSEAELVADNNAIDFFGVVVDCSEDYNLQLFVEVLSS